MRLFNNLALCLLAVAPTALALSKVGGLGYQGPGLYAITNYATGTAVDLLKGGTTKNTPVLS